MVGNIITQDKESINLIKSCHGSKDSFLTKIYVINVGLYLVWFSLGDTCTLGIE